MFILVPYPTLTGGATIFRPGRAWTQAHPEILMHSGASEVPGASPTHEYVSRSEGFAKFARLGGGGTSLARRPVEVDM